MAEHFGEVVPCKIEVHLARLLRLLRKGVQDVDRVGELCDVQDPVLAAFMEADLYDPGPDRPQGFPITRLQPHLHPVKLMTSFSARLLRKMAEPLQARPDPDQGLPEHEQTISPLV